MCTHALSARCTYVFAMNASENPKHLRKNRHNRVSGKYKDNDIEILPC